MSSTNDTDFDFSSFDDLLSTANEERNSLIEDSESDSDRIIEYLREQERQQKPYKAWSTILAVISATGAVVAAVCGIISLLH